MAAKKSVSPTTVKKSIGKVASKPSVSKAVAKTPPVKSETGAADFLPIGQVAPDFNLVTDDGSTLKLSSLRGKKVVLYFYPKDQTPGCTTQACDFRDSFNRIKSKGAVVLGVSADSVDSHRRFKEKQSLNFTLVSDPEKKALQTYGVWQEKSLYGRKFLGIVRTTYVIDEKGRIAHVFPKVKVAGHVDAVLAVL
jgi:thioredoxin-dependent peroxiredoxin